MAFLEIVASSAKRTKSREIKQRDLEILSVKSYSHEAWEGNNGDKNEFIIDIGGVHFVTHRKTLLSVPNTRLAALASRQSEHLTDLPRVFFDRNSFLFEYILDYYRTGELHLPSGRCGLSIKSELEFWGLDETCISTCCWKTYVDSIEEVTTQTRIREEFSELCQTQYGAEKNSCLRGKLWKFVDNPQSSKGATVYSMLSSLLVVLSLVLGMLATMPSFQVNTFIGTDNITANNDLSQLGKLERVSTTRPVDAIIYIDVICIVSVVFEFLVKLLVCPNRLNLLRSFSTFSDLVFVLPPGLILVLDWVDRRYSFCLDTNLYIWLQAVIALRVFRLHRLTHCIRGFAVLALSLKASAKELLLLIALALSASFVFAFAIFYAELQQEDTFPHAFMGMWWSLITMTSVGYGDVYPKTPMGYVIGGTCAIAGLILISLPVPLIANNFNTYYAYRDRQDRKSHCVWIGTCHGDSKTRLYRPTSSRPEP